MDLYDVVYVMIFFLIARAWWLTTSFREQAVKLAKNACDEKKVQLLDASVSLKSYRITRSETKSFFLLRYYKFEFSTTGTDRRVGTLALQGMRQYYLVMDLPVSATIDIKAD